MRALIHLISDLLVLHSHVHLSLCNNKMAAMKKDPLGETLVKWSQWLKRNTFYWNCWWHDCFSGQNEPQCWVHNVTACKESHVWSNDSLGLVDFAIGLVNSVLNLSKVFRGYSNYRGIYCKKDCLKLTLNKLMWTKSCVFKLIWRREIYYTPVSDIIILNWLIN